MRKVLLTQDLQDTFKKENTFLDRDDIAVFMAATTDEVLQIHRWEAVDLIILRLGMPGMDLGELLRTIRSSVDHRTINTILVSADAPGMRSRCRRYNVDAAFHLPADTTRLRVRVQHFLNVMPRACRRTALAVDIEGRYRDKHLPLRSLDISSRGMLIRSEAPLLRGDGIYFSFSLPDNTRVNGYGRIARDGRHATDAYSYGIKFTVIEPNIRSALDFALDA
jgi:CheY-like chemotaxis protein